METDVSTITQLINGVGFPIFACLAMGAFIVWDRKTNRKMREENNTKQDALYNSLKDSVDNNTRTIEKLMEKIDEMGKGGENGLYQ